MIKNLFILITLLASSSIFAAGWYDVELLVFSRDGAYTQEQIYSDKSQPDMSRAAPLKSNGSPIKLSKNSWKLGGEDYTLRKKSGYQPLYHTKWRQYISSKSRTLDVAINNSNIHGKLGVSVGRYLHIDLDVVSNNQGQAVRFKAKRRMKSRETHYLDHPKMGAFIRITRSPKAS